ncbi:MAG: hypothetical protein ACI30W_01870 [Muribaculaceae bacterium]
MTPKSMLRKMAAMAVVVTTALGFTACNDNDGGDDDDVRTIATIKECYTMIRDIDGDGTAVAGSNVSFTLDVNYTKMTADIAITGLALPGAGTMPKITLSGCRWTTDQSQWKHIDTNDFSIASAAGTAPDITGLKFAWLDRQVGEVYMPAIAFSFTLNGKYAICGSLSPFYFAGTTTTCTEGAADFVSTKPTYLLTLDNTAGTAKLQIVGAQFAQRMPAMDMTFEGLKAEFIADGSYRLSCEALTPKIGDTPYPNYPISDLSATLRPDSGMELTFVCTIGNTPFTVTAVVDYLGR